MRRAVEQFRDNITRVRELGALAATIEAMTTDEVDVSDVWRAQLVLAVSALDHYVHEIVRLGMVASGKGDRPQTDAYSKFPTPLQATHSALSGAPPEEWLGEAVRGRHSWLSFSDPDKLADALHLVSDAKLWESVGQALGQSPEVVKLRLKLIVGRRNKIAHEADLDPASPGSRWPIAATDASQAVGFVERVVEAIHATVV